MMFSKISPTYHWKILQMFHQQFIMEGSADFFGSKISMMKNQEVEQELKAMGETFHRRDARVRAMFETLASSQADVVEFNVIIS